MKVVILFLVSLLSGCALLDSTIYCSELSPEVRKVALERMQGSWSNYPEHSICDTEGFIIDVLKK